MLWPKKNSYEEFDNEKKFLWHQNPKKLEKKNCKQKLMLDRNEYSLCHMLGVKAVH